MINTSLFLFYNFNTLALPFLKSVKMNIRPIIEKDNKIIDDIIRQVLEEHEANLPGTAYFDEQLYSLSDVYSTTSNEYFVIENEGQVFGGAGIASLEEGEEGICELQKIYLSKKARGKGFGRALIEKCLLFAKDQGYTSCYLETMPQLAGGLKLYEKVGFEKLEKPLGNTMHHGCSIWMIKKL